jgi:hypothetical protein
LELRNAFLSANSLSFGNSQKSAGAKSGDYGGSLMVEMTSPAKNRDTRSKECAGALSW